MGGHYDKDIFKQLQEVLERSDRIENTMKDMIVEFREQSSRCIGVGFSPHKC